MAQTRRYSYGYVYSEQEIDELAFEPLIHDVDDDGCERIEATAELVFRFRKVENGYKLDHAVTIGSPF